MNIYLVYQNVNVEYDSYDSFVVVANTEKEAKYTHPDAYENPWNGEHNFSRVWCYADEVKVKLIGKADKKYDRVTIICSSFNAG